MPDPTWLELAKQAPFLAAFIWLVIVFLKHIKETQTEMREVIKGNSEVINECKEMFGRCNSTLERHDRQWRQ
jgi:hypothetical protein